MQKGLVFGGKCTELLASYDPQLQCLKMSQLSLLEEAHKSLEHLPKSGMIASGKLYQQECLVHHTSEKDGFVLPTPQAKEGTMGDVDHTRLNPNKGINQRFYTKQGRCVQRSLTGLAKIGMLPTPSASEHKYRLKGNTQASKCLEAQARKGLLTGQKGRLSPQFVTWMMGFPVEWLD
tara:strand:- start:317 stop:847 length:531 start_codon:yes stop_codon:yes gene_type:complete